MAYKIVLLELVHYHADSHTEKTSIGFADGKGNQIIDANLSFWIKLGLPTLLLFRLNMCMNFLSQFWNYL